MHDAWTVMGRGLLHAQVWSESAGTGGDSGLM